MRDGFFFFVIESFQVDGSIGDFAGLKDRAFRKSRVRIKFADAHTINLRAFGGAGGGGQELDHNAIRVETISVTFEQLHTHIGGVRFLSAFEISARKQDLHIHPLRIFGKHGADFGDGLRIQLALHIHLSERAASHANFRRLHSITATIESLQFALNGGVSRLRFKSAFHVPDRVVQFVFFVADNAHADVRDEIIGRRH